MAFDDVIMTIENDDMRKFALEAIKIIPPYFYEVAASSTGKYHPSYALGQGGLYRHTLAVVTFVNHMFSIDCFKNRWDSRGRDMIRIAAIMHDSFKSGTQEEYERNKYTKHEHPIIAAVKVREFVGCNIITDNEILQISEIIASHMGQWNTTSRSETVLPLPTNKSQQILHLADYLASRKDIEVLFT